MYVAVSHQLIYPLLFHSSLTYSLPFFFASLLDILMFLIFHCFFFFVSCMLQFTFFCQMDSLAHTYDDTIVLCKSHYLSLPYFMSLISYLFFCFFLSFFGNHIYSTLSCFVFGPTCSRIRFRHILFMLIPNQNIKLCPILSPHLTSLH